MQTKLPLILRRQLTSHPSLDIRGLLIVNCEVVSAVLIKISAPIFTCIFGERIR